MIYDRCQRQLSCNIIAFAYTAILLTTTLGCKSKGQPIANTGQKHMLGQGVTCSAAVTHTDCDWSVTDVTSDA